FGPSFYLLCIVAFLSMLSVMITNPVLSIFAKDIGATGVWIGISVSAYWISRVVLEIPSGYISSKYGYYKPMAFGLILTVGGNLLLLFVENPVHLILIRMLKGVGAPFFFATSMTFIINLVGKEKRGKAMGIFQGVEFIGQIGGALASGRLIESYGWQGGFMVALGLSTLALALYLIPPYIRKEVVQSPDVKPLKVNEVLGVLKNKTIIIIAIVTLAEFIMTSGLLGTVLSIYATETLGITLARFGYMMGIRSVGFVIAMFTMGSLADRIGRKPVLLFGIASTSVLVIVMSFFTSMITLSAIIAAIGFTSGAIWIMGPVISAEAVPPEKRGAAIGAYRTFFDLGSFIGPIVMAFIVDSYGIVYCFYLAGGLMLITLPLVLMIKETERVEGDIIAH
ncbi:MFS transporter, partial [Candidatus Bathyarchaeota archaeon]|nr:MFS transporter [Candidatus Bathyarchaeota archaeon]